MSAVLAIAAAPVATGSARPGQAAIAPASATTEKPAHFSDVLHEQSSPVTGEQGALAVEQDTGEEPVADDAARELAEILLMLQGAAANVTTLSDLQANADRAVAKASTTLPDFIQDALRNTEQMTAGEVARLQQQLAIGRQALAPGAGGAETPSSGVHSGMLELLQTIATGKLPPAPAEGAASGVRGDVATPLYALVAGQPAGAAAGAAGPALALPSGDAQAAFEQTLDRVVWMAREGLQQARLQLQPAHLGRIDIVLDMEGTEARLHMGSQQPQVRDALEALLPRLRDSLAEQGINLADASVADSGRQAAEQNPNPNSGVIASADLSDSAGSETIELPAVQVPSVGLLDLYV